MNRRKFITCSGTCLSAGAVALAIGHTASAQQPATPAQAPAPQQARPRYEFEIDIVEGKCGPHQAGQKIKYPEEAGKICPWLGDAMSGAIRVLQYGGTMPWLYQGTPYEKVIDPEGLTTEFIRCPDPSRVVVAKISRRRVRA